MLRFWPVLLSLFLFISCVGEVPKLSPISLISTSFNPGNFSTFAGGIIIVGQDQNGSRIHHSFPNGVITPFSIPRGDWKFYGVGYTGVSYVVGSSTKIAQMEGSIACGTVNVSVKTGKTASINLDLTPGGCSGELYRDLKIQNVKVEPCSYFGLYDFPYNTYYPSMTYGLNTCASIPLEQWGGIAYYKIVTLKDGGHEGLESRCTVSFLGDVAHMIPSSIVPIKIKTYRSEALCQKDEYRHSEYIFSEGIDKKYLSEFDSEFVPTQNVLFIPETHTKRYKSPFMNTLPRILCKNGSGQDEDCIPSSFTSTRSHSIDWNKPLKDVLLYTDPDENSCETLGTNSRFFKISDCKIKNKYLYATLSRNKLACMDSTTAGTITYKDIKHRDGRMYVLYVTSGNSYVGIYDDGGQLLIEYPVGPASSNWNALAVDKDRHFWVANAASSTIVKYKPLGPTNYTSDMALTGAQGIPAESLEVSEDGNYLFVGKQNTNAIIVLETTSGFFNITDTETLSEDVRKLQFYDGKLFAHGSDAPGVTNGSWYRMSFNSGQLDILQAPSAFTSKTFHIDNGYFITIGSGNEGLVYPNMVSQGLMTGGYGTGVNAFAGNVNRVQIVNYQLYGFEQGSTNLYTMGWTPSTWATGTWVTGASSTDSCTETFSIFDQGVTRIPSMTLTTHKTLPDNTQRNRELFHAAHTMLGHRYTNYAIIPLVSEMSSDQSRLNTGGYLSQVQRLLGPQGVGGMLHEFNDCTDINIMLLGGAIYRSYSVDDPYRGYQSFAIDILPNNDIIHPFICDDTEVNSSCPNRYEMKLVVRSTGLFETERYQLKLKCNSKVGQMRYDRINGERFAREQYYWNTNDETQSRFDAYKIKKESDFYSHELAFVFQQSNLIKGRRVLLENWTNYRRVSIDQYEKFANSHAVYHEEIAGFTSGVPVGDPSLFSSANYGVLRDDGEYSGNSTSCMSTGAVNIDVAPSVCVIAPIGLSNSKNVPLRLDSLENSATFENYFTSFP